VENAIENHYDFNLQRNESEQNVRRCQGADDAQDSIEKTKNPFERESAQ
jgi:hypothetical protein